jgi:hypothetical protein
MTLRKYTRADLPVGTFATVRARGGRGAFVARVDAFPATSRMAVGVNLDTGRRVRFSPARVLGATSNEAEACRESAERRAARIARLERLRRLDDGVDELGRPMPADLADALAARALDDDNADDAGMPTAAAAFLAAANYDTSDGLPPSDADPETGIQYGEVA